MALHIAGDLQSHPLARTYWSIFWHRASGRLGLKFGEHRKDLYFRHGEPFLAKSSLPSESLARFLLDRGLVDTARLDRATLLTTREQQTLAQALIASEAVRQNVLDAALVEREREMFLTAFRIAAAEVVFEPDPQGRIPRSAPRGDMFGLLREGIARHMDPERMMAELAPLTPVPLLRTAAFLRVLREVRLATDERRIIHALEGGRKMGELMSVSGVDPRKAVGVLYLARAVGLIRAASESEPDMERPEEIDDLPPTTRPTLLEEMLALPDPPVRPRIIQPSPPSRAAWQPRGLEGSARRPEPTRRVATGQPVSEPLPVPEDGPALQMLARDGYKVQRIIGRGACGTVYQAYQERLERMVAVKVLASMGPDATFRERFFREARSAARLNHPSIVTVFDCHGAEGVHYIVMELMEGTTLRDRVASEGPLAEADALSVVASLAAALDHAHARSILHRDVKPENVFLSADGQVKLGDWGLAKPFAGGDASVTQTGWVVGTPNYIAPEQLKGLKEIDPRADIYSLGATFYFLLTACPPFEGPSVVDVLASHLLEPPPDPRVKRPEVSAASAALVAATMEKSPSGRPASARDVREEALRIRESLAG